MIKYLGSKRTLVPLITELVTSIPDVSSVTDLFSGTSRVGHALKGAGLQVVSNDHNAYAHTLARCYVQADAGKLESQAKAVISELATIRPEPGYFTETFCESSRFFHPKNGARIDAIRERIAEMELEEDLEAVALVSLMEAADRVDSTTGLQMAYLKQWAKRAHNDLELRVPTLLPGPGMATNLDAIDAARDVRTDVVYLDPPYNQHSYRGNYHIWETLVLWDKPEVYGVACKRVDVRDRKSVFNSKPRAFPALKEVLEAIESPHLIISFSDEGYVRREEMEEFLRTLGRVVVIEVDFKRYVGAQIGIYSPAGEKVGAVSHLRNTEYLYIVTRDEATEHLLRARFGGSRVLT